MNPQRVITTHRLAPGPVAFAYAAAAKPQAPCRGRFGSDEDRVHPGEAGA